MKMRDFAGQAYSDMHPQTRQRAIVFDAVIWLVLFAIVALGAYGIFRAVT